MLLDRSMPHWHVRERHSTHIDRPPAEAMAAARAVTAREVPVLMVLMGVRSLPGLLARRRPGPVHAPLLDGFVRMGFAVLDDSGDELVCGGVGRFWQPSGGLRRVSSAEFGPFAEPGYAKAGFNFLAEPAPGGGCMLSTETRVLGTDAAARRRFRLYWAVVGPGSALIRRDWLRAIRRRAERSPAPG
jgi:hypothetical protein